MAKHIKKVGKCELCNKRTTHKEEYKRGSTQPWITGFVCITCALNMPEGDYYDET